MKYGNNTFLTYSFFRSKILPRLCLKEPKEKKDQSKIMKTYVKNCEDEDEDGAILFAVFRGKFSEGYDFKNDLCRGIIIVGVPNLSLMDHRV